MGKVLVATCVVAVLAIAGLYALPHMRSRSMRKQYGLAAPERFTADQQRARLSNDQWTLDIEGAIESGKPLRDFRSWTVGGSSKSFKKRFATAVRVYDKANGRT